MGFLTLRTVHFRNLADAEIPLDAPQVLFIGENGQGKTNLLEALYFLCFGASFRTRNDAQLVRHEAKAMSVRGAYALNGGASRGELSVKIEGSEKEQRIDGKIVRDRKELLSACPCIVFSHDDLFFVCGTPDDRRRFLNQTMSLFDPLFIDVLRRYHRLLRLRNAALKQRLRDQVDIYDGELAEAGLAIQERRCRACEAFNETFKTLFRVISGLSEELVMTYAPSWPLGSGADEVRELLVRRADADFAFGSTTSGPHRDRLHFVYGGRDFLKMASTGQLRLVSLILKVSQAAYFSKATGRRPLLLLDDVLLELDPERRERFLLQLPPSEQVLYTFLPGEAHEELHGNDSLVYHVKNGTVTT